LFRANDLEGFPELTEGQAHAPQSGNNQKDGGVPAAQPESSERPGKNTAPGGRLTQGLTPKREAWLMRVAQESKVGQDIVNRCLVFLQGPEGAEVKAFFDDLSRRKRETFRRFAVEAS